ncbi:hypothetical protein F4820DRAFT_466561 [Hypoxylon rubiginosum]|uniref:Uncharacterized protein n=1 Tax=Hypoxylon rubiginosum TaxID=110542 RepID=A0ACB9ZGZ9_9PEZI|nr:hypothetical protein F4820DRAFT_466561 [Hypoxylon rubiginosum]
MPRLKNARSRKQEEREDNLRIEDDEPTITKPMEVITTNAKDHEPPKKKTRSRRGIPRSNPPSPLSNNPGLNWEWVKTVDQDPTGKDYFPAPFDPPEDYRCNGLDIEKPNLDLSGDLREYSIWVLARIRRMRQSNAVAAMIADPNVKIKWVISVNTYWKNTVCHYREIVLGGTGPNHEAAYAAMCGVVLPPEAWCENCKANKSVFTFCIVLPGYLTGACVGCHLNHSGSRCSHRPDAKTRVRPTAIPLAAPLPPSTRKQSRKPPSVRDGGVQTLTRRQRTSGDTSKATLRDLRELMLAALVRIDELERKLD